VEIIKNYIIWKLTTHSKAKIATVKCNDNFKAAPVLHSINKTEPGVTSALVDNCPNSSQTAQDTYINEW